MPFQQGSARTRQRTVLLVGIVVLLAALVLAVVLASVLTHGERGELAPKMLKWKDRGTTKNLQEVVLGRCYSYVMARYPELG